MALTRHAHAPLALERLDDLRQLGVVDRNARLLLEALGQVGPAPGLVARAEEGDDLAAEVAQDLALVRRLAAEEREIDEAGERVRLREKRGVSEPQRKESGEGGSGRRDAPPTP